MEPISLDDLFFKDRQSSYIVQLTGKSPRLGLWPGDKLLINRALPFRADQLALVVVKGKFQIERLSEQRMKDHDPEQGDFIWGMVQTVIREFV